MRLRSFWCATDGWCIETPIALTPTELERCVAFIRRQQGPRVASMAGDKREQAAAALRSLSSRTLKQRIIARPGAERVLYAKD